MAKLFLGTREVTPVIPFSSGKYQLLQRIKDDTNTEIGTVSGFVKNSNDTEYAVVCLDAQYRTFGQFLSARDAVNIPNLNNWVNSYWYGGALCVRQIQGLPHSSRREARFLQSLSC